MAKKVLSDELIELHLDIPSEIEYSQDFSSAQSDNDLAKNRENLYQMNGVGDSENEPSRYAAFTSANCSTFLDENINEESTNPQPIISGPKYKENDIHPLKNKARKDHAQKPSQVRFSQAFQQPVSLSNTEENGGTFVTSR
ncbi:unnamed protein product [Danaus chrysippus]|uniref:(African queen) hypothetical protein n=1 Tax=Danaus chrysippus TaxID=151541 RepID=A0A8J2Q9Y7_9NEOP|nr:unnamed protein product [Danaus chrysippus]